MEFTRSEDATRASNCSEHLVNEKKASVQFFKAKDPQQPKKRHFGPESNDRHNAPLNDAALYNCGQNNFSTQGRAVLPFNEFSKYSSHCGNQMSAYSHYHNFPNPLADLANNKAPVVVQPPEPRRFGQQRWWNDYYTSLKQAEEALFYHHTYANHNLRFNKLRRSQF